MAAAEKRSDKALGVTVEASYTVGEYDIVILSGKQSDGLETWLRENGYRMPRGAAAALKPYIRQQMKFFVAKVNLEEQARTGVAHLRPLQFAFESERFMLPVRLGMLNANGPQDLVLYVLTAGGRVETTNYRTVKIPANMDLPVYVRGEFARTYKQLFTTQAAREDYRAIFTEYFWDMSWCDPCAGNPLSPEELRQVGVFWVGEGPSRGGGQPVMLTRLHLRYTRDSLPEDLVFQETQDRANFQARYVLASSVGRARRRLRRREAVFRIRAGAQGTRSADAGVAHRRQRDGHSRPHGVDGGAAGSLVGDAVEMIPNDRFARAWRAWLALARNAIRCCATRACSRSRSWRRCSRSAYWSAISRCCRSRWRSHSPRDSPRKRCGSAR